MLAKAEIDVLGRMPWSSNSTFLVDLIIDDDSPAQAIYKPAAGERQLWDFPDGLFVREAAAFALSHTLGWDLVPPTIVRDGPMGEGSLQLFVPADFEQHYFTLQDDPLHTLAFQRICVFDVVANNTDRKSGHCLLGTDGQIWAIDNGLAFHHEFKLRTVLWDYAGEEIPAAIADDLRSLIDNGLPDAVTGVLSAFEIDALWARTNGLLLDGTFPIDPTGRRYPWPLV